MPPTLALLIDAENISYKDLPHVLEAVPRHGQLVLQAVYGDWQNPTMQKWHEIANQHHFKIRHQTGAAKSKNASDMKLIMDAMEVLYRTSVDAFCLVSNDADYVPLCDKLRESKKYVIGIGYRHASEAFIRACDTFVFIGRGEATTTSPAQSLLATPVETLRPAAVQSPMPQPSAQPSAPPKPIDQAALKKLLKQAFARAPQDADRWVLLSPLGELLRKEQTDFRTSMYGHATLSKLLQSMPEFVELRKNGAGTYARLKK